jgi:hypothetical protein
MLGELQLTPTLVVLAMGQHLPLDESLVLSLCRIYVGHLTCAPYLGNILKNPHIGLIDGGVTSILSAWFSGLQIRNVFLT